MPLPHVLRSTPPGRFAVGALMAALAFTSCGVTTGQSSIEAAAPSPTAAVAPTTAPLATPTATATATPATTARGERAEAESSDVAETDGAAPADEEVTETDVVEVPETIVEAEASDPDDTATEQAADRGDTDTADFNQTSGTSCMEGIWHSQPGQFGAYIDHVAGLTGAPMVGSGQLTVSLQGGRYVYDVATLMSINVDGFETLTVVEGLTQGTYEYTNGFVIAEQTFAEIDAYVELPDGTRLDAGILGDEFNELAAFHEVPFDCVGPDQVTFHFETMPGNTRFPMTFARQGS